MTYCIIYTASYLWNRRNVGFGCLIHILGSTVTCGAFPLVPLAAPSQTVPCWFTFDQQLEQCRTRGRPSLEPDQSAPVPPLRRLPWPTVEPSFFLLNKTVLRSPESWFCMKWPCFFCRNAFPCCCGLIQTESNGFKLSQRMCMKNKSPISG